MDTFKLRAHLAGDFDAWTDSDGIQDDRIDCRGAVDNDNEGGWYEDFVVTAESPEQAREILVAALREIDRIDLASGDVARELEVLW